MPDTPLPPAEPQNIPQQSSVTPPHPKESGFSTRDWLVIIGMIVAAVSAYFNLLGMVNKLEPEKIAKAQETAIKAIEEKYKDTSRLLAESNFAPPVGTILAFAGEEANIPKTGTWRLCDGKPISRTDYKDLFDTVGISWGEGDKKTTFNLPDLQGQFLRGADSRQVGAVDPGAPRMVGSLQAEEFPQHSHDISSLCVAGGLLVDGEKILAYRNTNGRKEKLGEPQDKNLKTMWSGGGESNTLKLQGGNPTVFTMGLLGALGEVQAKKGEVHPTNRAVNFIIRVKP